MEATTIAVIVLVTLFLGALGAFVVSEEAPKKAE